MTKKLIFEDQVLEFQYNDQPKFWRSKAILEDKEAEILIDLKYHHQEEIDWPHFEEFFSLIKTPGLLSEILTDSKDLVEELGRAYFRKYSHVIAEWSMTFSNVILYNGKPKRSNENRNFSYSLLYSFEKKSIENAEGDDFGSYLIKLEDLFIIGAERQ